jgi:hypothetical protein
MTAILHSHLPFAPWADPVHHRLPGTRAAGLNDWLMVDEVFAEQMALRDRLIAEKRERVIAMQPGARAAADELLEMILGRLAELPGFDVSETEVLRPDGVAVPLGGAEPMAVIGRLTQADMCILQDIDGEHVLTAAALCFPAGWTLTQKLGMPMGRIHLPVERYLPEVAARVERMMANLKPGHPIRRANVSTCHDPSLFRPLREGELPPPEAGRAPYIRLERQVLFRLPRSGAVAFSIHTLVAETRALTADQAEALKENPLHLF